MQKGITARPLEMQNADLRRGERLITSFTWNNIGYIALDEQNGGVNSIQCDWKQKKTPYTVTAPEDISSTELE